MNVNWQNWNFSIFLKLVIMFLLVITPLYTLGLFINERGEESVRKEISNSLESRVQFYLNTLVVEVERMIQLQKEYIVDKDLQRLVFADEIFDQYEWAQRVLELQKKLRVIESSSIYIKNITAYIPINGYVVSSKRSMGPIPEEEYKAISASIDNHDPLFYWQERLFINRAFPDPVLFNKEESYTLSIELSVEALRQSLSQFTNYENAGVVLMNMQENWSLSNAMDARMIPYLSRLLEDSLEKKETSKVTSMNLDQSTYLVAYQWSPLINSVLVVYMPQQEILGQLDTYRNWFWLLSFVSIFIIIVFSFWIYRMIHQPLTRLIKSFRSVEKGRLELIDHNKHRDEFGYLYKQFNAMVGQLKVLIHKVYEQKIRAQSSELKQLQSQINPHFLYNTYFILYRLARARDLDNVIRFSRYLGDYFQYITRNASNQVPLEMEVKHTKTYINIQTIRFSDRIEVEMEELPEACGKISVPRLFLQPIVENAYKYGMDNKKRGGVIKVLFEKCENILTITIEDNGRGMPEEQIGVLQNRMSATGEEVETTGIVNVHRRLQLMFGFDYGITLTTSSMGGLKVDMMLYLDHEHVGIHSKR